MTASLPPVVSPAERTTLRLFVALGLSDDLRQALASRCAALHGRLPRARWVPSANLHLTLCFLGATATAAIPALDAALRPVFAAAPPGRLVLTGGGTVPPGRPGRAAWVAVGTVADGAAAVGPDLVALAAAVSAAVASALPAVVSATRDPRSEHGFTPHVTLARPQVPWNRQASEAFARAWSDAANADLSCRVDEGWLMASELGSGPPRYRLLSRYPLLDGGRTGPAAS